jgi:phosphoribosylamine--glycine ligase
VLKADGLAAGKGVFLPGDGTEAAEAMNVLFPGGAGRVVAERRLSGPEVSVMALCSGTSAFILPPSRDHKRAFDGDAGPNTGGMGAVCPAPGIPADLVEWTRMHVFLPVLRELEKRGIDYRGALYAGIILSPGGPSVLEFNCRFGDPETQAVLTLVEGDTGKAFMSCAEGNPCFDGLSVRPGAAACVVIASGGYPGAFRKGFPITGISEPEGVSVYHSGTCLDGTMLVTGGGRVLGVTGVGGSLDEALATAYEAVGRIGFEGAFWRRDIGRTI